MKRSSLFSLIFLTTITMVRAWVFLFPQRKIVIDETIIHHFWIGVIFILLVLFIPKALTRSTLAPFALGLGLVVDELIYMVLGDGAVSRYWSIPSVVGTAVLAVLVVVFRTKLTNKLT